MNKKWLRFLALLLIVALLGWWLLIKPKPEARQPKQTSSQGNSAQLPETNRVASTASPPLAQPGKFKTTEQLKKEYTSLNDRPIEFYGKAIDQYGDPVPDADVIGDVLIRKPGTEGVRKFRLKTDASGFFAIKDMQGESLEVGVRKVPGYYNGHVEGHPGQGYLARYSLMYKDIHKPDPNNPIIFKMWKLVGPESIIDGKGFYGIIPDGRPYTFDLVMARKHEGKSDNGDLVIQVHRPPNVGPKERYDWSFELAGVRGGILEISADEAFPYLAPEFGYQPTYLHAARSSDPQWTDRVKKRFFIKSRDGKVYGQVEAEIFANYQNEGVFRVQYFLNPSSSRNLERDPKKRMTKEEISNLNL